MTPIRPSPRPIVPYLVWIVLACATAAAVEPPPLTAEFDAHHRTTHLPGTDLLVIVADDATTTIAIEARFEHFADPIERQVRFMRYRDADSVWIVSRLGRRLNGAILYDISNDEVIDRYRGRIFSVSPDGAHLAFTYPAGMESSHLFVDDSLIYPEVEHGFRLRDVDGPAKPDAPPFYSSRPGPDLSSSIESPIRWKSDRALEAIFAQAPSSHGYLVPDRSLWRHIRFEAEIDFGGPGDDPRIMTKQVPLQPYEVRSEMNRIREAEGLPKVPPPPLKLR